MDLVSKTNAHLPGLAACFALVLVACGGGDSAGEGGVGGEGAGGVGGAAECTGALDCDDGNECTQDLCSVEGSCSNPAFSDGRECTDGLCVVGGCEPVDGVFPCTEQGLLDAIEQGGGPYGLACEGPQTITPTAEIVIDNDVILDGLGNLSVDGAGQLRPFVVAGGVTTELRRFTVANGFALEGSGGGVLNEGALTLTETIVSGCLADTLGGGVSNLGMDASLALDRATIDGNTAGLGGGGLYSNGELLVTSSTVSGNTADAGSDGGGLLNEGFPSDVVTSTVSGNRATGNGGGIASTNAIIIGNSTISGNTADGDGGGLRNQSVMQVSSCTVADNVAATGSALSAVDPNGLMAQTLLDRSIIEGTCAGDPVSPAGNSVESPGDTCGLEADGSDQVSVSADDLDLGSLSDNGGSTETHSLAADSVAVDAIASSICGFDEDQRGVARPQGAGCDVGAFERDAP